MEDRIKELYRTSYQMRRKTIEMIYHAKTGHGAPCLSMAEIITTLYFDIMKIDSKDPHWEDRDRFVLSKGHASPIFYAILARKGFFSEEDIFEYRALNSKLQGHPDMKKCPGVDMSSGSLGNGIATALGMALIAKKDNKKYNVYAICGDGELDEGIVWETALFAGNKKLDNMIVFIDRNGLQSGGSVEKIQDLNDLQMKFEAFKWDVQTIDGHDIEAIISAVANAKNNPGRPHVIIANTIKGKGVSYMEGQFMWHMKAPNDEQYELALKELKEAEAKYE